MQISTFCHSQEQQKNQLLCKNKVHSKKFNLESIFFTNQRDGGKKTLRNSQADLYHSQDEIRGVGSRVWNCAMAFRGNRKISFAN